MGKKTRHTHAWLLSIGAIVLLLSGLILYWYTTDREPPSDAGAKKTATAPHATEVSPAARMSEAAVTAVPAKASADTETPQTETATPDPVAVTAALDYLDALEAEQSSRSPITDGEAGDRNTSELTENEMFQLVREGVSYYDTLIDSGSADFFMQISSASAPGEGMTQAPNGTWEGTFAFSGNRVAGSVTQKATEYNEQHGSIPVFDTKNFAYDGETFEELRETPNGTLLTRGSDRRYNPAHDPRFWGWNLSDGKPLTELIGAINVEQIQSVQWNNASVYHIQGTVEDAVEVELWINPQKSFRPERFLFATEGTEQRHQVIKDFDFIEVAPDLWFPKSAEAVTSLLNLATGAETQLDTTTMHLSNVRVNETIPANRFTLDPSPGATVFDTRTHDSFKVE